MSKIGGWILRLLTNWWFPTITVDYENNQAFQEVLKKGSLIVLPVHKSFMDGPLIWDRIAPVAFAAKSKLARGFLGKLLSLGGTFYLPSDLKNNPAEILALKTKIKKILAQKIPIGVFVQGGRSAQDQKHPAKSGLLSIILECLLEEGLLSKASYVAVGIAYEKRPESKSLFRRLGKVNLRVGLPKPILEASQAYAKDLSIKALEEAYQLSTPMLNQPCTIVQLFYRAVHRYQTRPAIKYPIPFGTKGPRAWQELNWIELKNTVQDISKILWEWGVRPGDKIAIYSKSRPEWEILDLAVILFGGVTVGIHPSLGFEEVHKIVADCQAKILALEESGPNLKFNGLKTISLKDLENLRKQAPIPLPDWQRACEALKPENLLTIIYTSGTTDKPKGVALTHQNITSIVTSFPPEGKGPPGTILIYLPLSHILQRAALYRHFVGGTIAAYGTLATFREDLKEAKPTTLAAVPEILDRIREGILETVNKQSWLKRKIFYAALKMGGKIAYSLVLHKVYDFFGGRLKYIGCGGAPLSLTTARFFWACNVLVFEGYGLSETSAPAALNTPQAYRLGTVGKPFPGVQIRIAEDEEILIKGKGIAKTEAVDEEGWLHTGDCGRWDKDGFLIITGRKKDIIVTRGGEKIHPHIIEERIETHPWIQRAVVYGEAKPYLVSLIWLNQAGFNEKRTTVEREIRKHLAKVNQSIAKFEKIQNFTVVQKEITLELGKLKRQEIYERFRPVIEKLYERTLTT